MSATNDLARIKQAIAALRSDGSVHQHVKMMRLQELNGARERAEKEVAALESGAKRWERFRRKVRVQMRERAEQREAEAEAVAAMTPLQLTQYLARQRDPLPHVHH